MLFCQKSEWVNVCFLMALYICLPNCLNKWVPFQLKPLQCPPWSEFPVSWFLRPILDHLVTLADWMRQIKPANVDISVPLGRGNNFVTYFVTRPTAKQKNYFSETTLYVNSLSFLRRNLILRHTQLSFAFTPLI